MEEINQIINEWARQSLNASLAYPIYFIAGLLASLFPCVYPLYPITAGFLRKRARKKEAAWKHPAIYCAAMVLVYTLLGSFATLSGGAFNYLMQNGVVITLLGFFFLFLAFVSMDWFSLRWDRGQDWMQYLTGKEGGLFTFLMGSLAGLVASACVAPVLVSMLVLLAQNSPDNFLYRLWWGGSLSLTFGAGISLPFFMIGVLGMSLPRSGYWQAILKYTFALLIAFAAFYQIQKGLETLGWESERIYLLFGAMLLSFFAVLLGLRPPISEEKNRSLQTKFYFALLSIGFAFAMLTRSFIPMNFKQNSSSPKIESSTKKTGLVQTYEKVGPFRFYRDPDFAMQLAREKKKVVFIDFYAHWCSNCKDFTRLILKDKRLGASLRKAVLVKIYDTDPVFEKYKKDPRFPELRIGLPFFVVLDSEGKLLWKTTNHRDSRGMERAIKGEL